MKGKPSSKEYEIATPAFGGLAMTDFWVRPIVIASLNATGVQAWQSIFFK
jgi:hypothetical protein